MKPPPKIYSMSYSLSFVWVNKRQAEGPDLELVVVFYLPAALRLVLVDPLIDRSRAFKTFSVSLIFDSLL